MVEWREDRVNSPQSLEPAVSFGLGWGLESIWNGGLTSFFEAGGMALPMKPISLEECLCGGLWPCGAEGSSPHMAVAQAAQVGHGGRTERQFRESSPLAAIISSVLSRACQHLGSPLKLLDSAPLELILQGLLFVFNFKVSFLSSLMKVFRRIFS